MDRSAGMPDLPERGQQTHKRNDRYSAKDRKIAMTQMTQMTQVSISYARASTTAGPSARPSYPETSNESARAPKARWNWGIGERGDGHCPE
jgi:hypothetical protein